jgi:hypothetical protein
VAEQDFVFLKQREQLLPLCLHNINADYSKPTGLLLA